MPYTIPEMPLDVAIYRGPWATKTYVETVKGNLAVGRRTNGSFFYPDDRPYNYGYAPILLLPFQTDIRDTSCQYYSDIVEVPEGTGRWYSVVVVDDYGKGFANEHRFACIAKINETNNDVDYPGVWWPAPIP